MNKNEKTVFVGVSGGVDSSVSAILLKKQDYNVAGVFIRTWTPDFIECTWRDERRDAMRVCASIGIPFLECDAEDAYKKGVADYMIEEYKKGNTPNPDVMCNREVKFGVFWDFAKKNGADFIATGHYSQISLFRDKSSFQSSLSLPRSARRAPTPVTSQRLLSLRKGIDLSKDQSYFLWTLTQKDLSHTLFPIGHLEKKEVRKLAKKYKIPTATKKDSQGVCFLGPLDMKDFLKHYIKPKKGKVLNEDGKIIGHHEGSVFFTLGERKGFIITEKTKNEKPLYVISKNIKNNTITVSNNLNLNGEEKNTIYNLINTNWISDLPILKKNYFAQIRYHGKFLKCNLEIDRNKKTKVIFSLPVLVDSGQSIVVYDEDICLGGGIVS